MKILLNCDCEGNRALVKKFYDLGYELIFLPKFPYLPMPVSSHADMLIYRLRDGRLLTFSDYFRRNKGLFEQLGCEFVLTDEAVSCIYPYDICLNALRLGDTVFGKLDRISRYIYADAGKRVSIKQGYARCSVCIIDEKNIITADKGIADAAEKNGISVTRISAGNITLDGYNYGFIGGACVTAEENAEVYFFGDVFLHPGGKKIAAAIESCGLRAVSLFEGSLCDYGGGIVLT